MADDDHDKIIRLEEGQTRIEESQKNMGDNIGKSLDSLNRDRRFIVVAVIAQVILKATDYFKVGQ